jgi:single-stranded-DNA-specific exonuclease
MGDGRHLRFSVTSGGTHARAVAFGCDGRLDAQPGEPVDASFRLERNFWNGAVEARLLLGHARRCVSGPIEALDEPEDYLRAVLDELDASEPDWARPREQRASTTRTLLDRRGESALAVLSDALATGGPVLAICADVTRRLRGLSTRIGGFSLTSYHALARDQEITTRFPQLVELDPPSSAFAAQLLASGCGYTHLAWGEPELRFAQQMHELEYGLRAPLVALYRSLRRRRRVAGEELEHLLRGDGPHDRPARLAARLIKVLAELELVSLDRNLLAPELAGSAPTALERSASYRAYAQRYEDGRRYLSSANPRPSA